MAGNAPICRPDLSSRPLRLTVERDMDAAPAELFDAWTQSIDRWFAAPGSVLMRPDVDAPYFFETRYDGERHPHYGRFLALDPDRIISMTWLTAAGTKGFETVVTVELTPKGSGTHLRLTHSGFPDEESRDGHREGWAIALEHLDEKTRGSS